MGRSIGVVEASNTPSVTCHNYFILIYFSDKGVKLIIGGSVINGAYPV